MRNAYIASLCVIALAAATAAVPAAQQSDNAKKPAKQTHDTGVDADDNDALAPGQKKKIGDKSPEGATVTRRANGVLAATLDETFHDAIVATRAKDGTVTYTCLHGLPLASAHVEALSKPTAPVTPRAEEK